MFIVGTGVYTEVTVNALHAFGTSGVAAYSISGHTCEFVEGRGIG